MIVVPKCPELMFEIEGESSTVVLCVFPLFLWPDVYMTCVSLLVSAGSCCIEMKM